MWRKDCLTHFRPKTKEKKTRKKENEKGREGWTVNYPVVDRRELKLSNPENAGEKRIMVSDACKTTMSIDR